MDGRGTITLVKGESMLLLCHVGNSVAQYAGRYIEEIAHEKSTNDGVLNSVKVCFKHGLWGTMLKRILWKQRRHGPEIRIPKRRLCLPREEFHVTESRLEVFAARDRHIIRERRKEARAARAKHVELGNLSS